MPCDILENAETTYVKLECPPSPQLTFPALAQSSSTSLGGGFVPIADIPPLDLDGSGNVKEEYLPNLVPASLEPAYNTHLGIKPESIQSIDSYMLANYGVQPASECYQQSFYVPSPVIKPEDYNFVNFVDPFDMSNFCSDTHSVLAELEQMFAPIPPTATFESVFSNTMTLDEPVDTDLGLWFNYDQI
ncbi:hypothetical protein SERLA73DRAFT_176144 [Serpula lacrymans var. lacrymans S7.3]|uniref:Uncharacterized protein n=2 Tax=Serpula lacrymans var. lacrymans TaxID=341189 RepID=F8PME2_SERL3|nr:uncharacterized protein SERLADRAFT_458916 [Serpula lacrymans var. lacrymans S7.9]EGO02774.1 hypothetical protein SERLA73DRAFT_176144 [Serpula lacrymans var. lacrymans S7.3]EGO28475.1 hypothetical protein SERLADRAFT_458916 [Serpula lacrymans var. lacrymans S7.9]